MSDRKHIFKPADKQYMGAGMVCIEVLTDQAPASGPLNASNAYWVGAVLVERNNRWHWMMTKGLSDALPLLPPADVAAMQEVAQQVIEARDMVTEQAHYAADRA